MMPVKLSDHAVAVSDCSRKRDRIRGNPWKLRSQSKELCRDGWVLYKHGTRLNLRRLYMSGTTRSGIH